MKVKSLLFTEFGDHSLGSDQNEQVFAYIMISYAGGRSRFIYASTMPMAFGMERRNGGGGGVATQKTLLFRFLG